METQGGLYVPAGKERHVFKAPAPRPSLLGRALQAVHQDHCSPALGVSHWLSSECSEQGVKLRSRASMHVAHAGLDKLAQQKRDDAGSKALPALGKRPRPDLDFEEEAEPAPAASTSQSDDDHKSKQRHYRSSRLDTPSHPGAPAQATFAMHHKPPAGIALSHLACMTFLACQHACADITLACIAKPVYRAVMCQS